MKFCKATINLFNSFINLLSDLALKATVLVDFWIRKMHLEFVLSALTDETSEKPDINAIIFIGSWGLVITVGVVSLWGVLSLVEKLFDIKILPPYKRDEHRGDDEES